MPQNAGYMVAAYVVVTVVVLGYAWSLWQRARVAIRLADGADGGGRGRQE